MQIINVIPNLWKKYIRENYVNIEKNFHNIPIRIKGNMQDLIKIHHKTLYRYLIEEKNTKSKANLKFSDIYDINDLEWKIYYKMPTEIKVENKIKEFQYKILHKYLPTNKLLFFMKLKDSPRCNFCFVYTQTIQHLFWECLCIHNMWMLLQR